MLRILFFLLKIKRNLQFLSAEGVAIYAPLKWMEVGFGVNRIDAFSKRIKGQLNRSKSKGTLHCRTGHEGPEGEQIYSATLSSTSALDGGEWSVPHPGRCTHGKETRHHLCRGLDGPPGPVWTEAENLAPSGIRSPDRPARISETNVIIKISNPGLPWKKLRSTRRRLSLPANWT